MPPTGPQTAFDSPPLERGGKRAYRRREARDAYGVSLSMIDAAVRRGEIRTKRYGSAVFLSVEDCDRLWNPDVEVEIRPEDVSLLRRLVR